MSDTVGGPVVVVGASAAGLATVEGLRRGGFDGPLTLVGAERQLPYDRPPLSKQVLSGDWDPDRIVLCREQKVTDLDLDLRLGATAAGLDLAGGRVLLADGGEVPFERLVVATGVSPRRLPGTEGVAGVHVLRTLEDTLALREQLGEGRRVVIVGAGFLGTELAAAARGHGAEVWLVEPEPVPLAAAVGAEVGAMIAGLHTGRGVHLRTGPDAAVKEIRAESGTVSSVLLADGTELAADVVVVAIGSVPNTAWLTGSGLETGDGLICDRFCAAGPKVHAAGDVASWFHEGIGAQVRLEHRTNAGEQGMYVAKAVLGAASAAFTPVPYFWTDQYDVKVQAFGYLRGHEEVRVVDGSVADGEFVALYRRGDRLAGVLGVKRVKAIRTYRALVASGASWAEALAAS